MATLDQSFKPTDTYGRNLTDSLLFHINPASTRQSAYTPPRFHRCVDHPSLDAQHRHKTCAGLTNIMPVRGRPHADPRSIGEQSRDRHENKCTTGTGRSVSTEDDSDNPSTFHRANPLHQSSLRSPNTTPICQSQAITPIKNLSASRRQIFQCNAVPKTTRSQTTL